MRMRFYFGLTVTVGAFTVACSSDGSKQSSAGTGGRTTNINSASRGGATTASAGGSTGMTSGGPGGSSAILGEVLTLVPGTGDVPYAIGPNPYGIQGNAFLAKSTKGNTITVGDDEGKICIKGSLEEVPNGDYGGYWGVEIGFNLNQPTNEGQGGASGGGAGDAGGAGGVGETGTSGGSNGGISTGSGGSTGTAGASSTDVPSKTKSWLPGEVIGFSFVIEGPTINLVRFKALPSGFDAALESSVYCKGMTPVTNTTNVVLFSEMAQYCWNVGANVFIPTGKGLDNISWQLPADANVGVRPFDWCLTEIRPILSE